MAKELVALLKCWNVTGFTVDWLKLAKSKEAKGNSNDLAVVERLSMVKALTVVTEGKPFSEEVPSPLPA